MSRNARACDRCGKLYVSYSVENEELMPHRNNEMNGIMPVDLDDEGKYFSGKALDLCPECMARFLKFTKDPTC